jgi:cytochrome P450
MGEIMVKDPYSNPHVLTVRKNVKGEYPPLSGLMMPFGPTVMFNRADVLEDVFVRNNAHYSKSDIMRLQFSPMFSKGMGGMETADPNYQEKRKIMTAAFFKQKLQKITQIAKDVTIRHLREI